MVTLFFFWGTAPFSLNMNDHASEAEGDETVCCGTAFDNADLHATPQALRQCLRSVDKTKGVAQGSYDGHKGELANDTAICNIRNFFFRMMCFFSTRNQSITYLERKIYLELELAHVLQ